MAYEMIDVLERLRELDKQNPDVHLDAIENTEKMNSSVEEAKAKPDFLDLDKDGNKKEPMKKAAKDKKEKVKESITIAADSPEDLPVIAQIMKLAGMEPVTPDMMPDKDNVPTMKADDSINGSPCGDDYANTPDEETDEGFANSMGDEREEPTYKGYDKDYAKDVGHATRKTHNIPANSGDNPLEAIEEKLRDAYQAFKEIRETE
jgi:hypothetical protein